MPGEEQGWSSECTGASPAWPWLPWKGPWLPWKGVEAGEALGGILYFPSLFFTFTPSSGWILYFPSLFFTLTPSSRMGVPWQE